MDTMRAQHPVFGVEHHQPKCSSTGAVLRQQQRRDLARRAQSRTFGCFADERAPPELDGGQHPGARATTPRTSRRSSDATRVSPRSPPKRSSSSFARLNASRAAEPPASTSASSSLSPSAPAPRRSSFSRGRSCGASCRISSILEDLMFLPPPRARAATWLCVLLALCGAAAGCAEPPTKEIDQAQAAIEVAVSAGAERFAAPDLAGARTALTQARDAVGQRLQAGARPRHRQPRARTDGRARGGDARAALKRDTQAALADVMALQARAQRRIDTAASGPARARAARPPGPGQADHSRARSTHTGGSRRRHQGVGGVAAPQGQSGEADRGTRRTPRRAVSRSGR